MTQTSTPKTTRAERLAMPLAREVVRDLAVEHGACIRPVQLRRTDVATGAVEQVLVPCGHTLATVCPACAERARTLRAAQCREGWHLEERTDHRTGRRRPRTRSGGSKSAPRHRSCATTPTTTGRTPSDLDELTAELDEEITDAGMRGNVLPARPVRRHRTTRRRQDAAPLPRRKIAARTVGKTYTTADGKTFRPSLFVTLTCPSYGRVRERRHPGRPGHLRLPAGGAGRAALRGAVRPVHPEPAPLPRLRPAVLRRHRAATAARPPCPSGHARHRLAYRPAPRPGRDLSPGVVARHLHRPVRRRPAARLGRAGSAPTSTPRPAKSCRPGMTPSTPSATRTSHCMWPGSGTGSTPRVCSPGPRTPHAASVT